MKSETDHLINLINQAIEAAKNEVEKSRKLNTAYSPTGMATRTVENLIEIKKNILNGKIQKSNGATLGLTRHIGEWCSEGPLYQLAHEIDIYFSEKMA